MRETKYEVSIDGAVVGNNMDLDYALLFVRAIFDKFYNDHEMVVSITEMCEVKE